MQFYILLSGTLLFLMILEYTGTLMQERMPPRLKRLLCEMGNSAFVCFVSIALTLPLSSFSYILFCFGTTKMLYPQMHYTLWRAFEFGSETNSHWSESSSASAANAFLNKHKAAAELMKLASASQTSEQVDAMLARASTAEMCASATVVAELSVAVSANDEAEQKHVLNIHSEWSIGFVVHFSSGCGLMLHHFSLTMIFCAHCMHLLFTDGIIFYNVLIGILILVLSQHLVGQVVTFVPLRALMLVVVEIIFQWFSISVMGDGGSSIGTVGTFGLMVSHMMMAPEVPFELFSSCSTMRDIKQEEQKRAAETAPAAEAPTAVVPAAPAPVEAIETVGV
jgi:hypothetical protein